MPKKPDEELIETIVGMYFHVLDSEKHVIWQGRIIGKEDAFYVVQLFDALTGYNGVIQTVNQSDFLTNQRINLYRTSEDMKWWHEYKARKE